MPFFVAAQQDAVGCLPIPVLHQVIARYRNTGHVADEYVVQTSCPGEIPFEVFAALPGLAKEIGPSAFSQAFIDGGRVDRPAVTLPVGRIEQIDIDNRSGLVVEQFGALDRQRLERGLETECDLGPDLTTD